MAKYPLSVKAVFLFLWLSLLIWLAFALLAAADLYAGLPDSQTARWIMAGLAFGCACALFMLIVLLNRRVRIAYFATLGLLVLLAVLTFADEVGLADWAYLAIVDVPFVLMIRDRNWFLQKSPY
jgi:hypothetical protein